MRILCTNDDGIHADGLGVIEEIARTLSDDVWVVAPETDQSGVGRALTLSHPLRVREVGPHKFAIAGTPADCVQLGAHDLLAKDGRKPDLILSGVNNGQNIAEDVTVSGTIAAAFQGMATGIPSVAMSLARFSRDQCHWETPRTHGPGIIKRLVEQGWPDHVVLNVNFPDREPEAITDIVATAQGVRDQVNLFTEERVDLRGRRYYWYGFEGTRSNPPEGTDLHAIYNGKISITPLHLSLTDEGALSAIRETFGR